MRAFVFCVICLVSSVAVAQQPACPNGRCVTVPPGGFAVVYKPVDAYQFKRGVLPWQVNRSWQVGTSRGTFRRGLIPWRVSGGYQK